VAHEHLARLSLFVDAARKGEMVSHHDSHHTDFEELFHRLEVSQEGGLYAAMCALSHVSDHLSDATVIEPDVVETIRSIRVPSPRNEASRHLRDYIVATSVLHVARGIAHDMRQLLTEL